VMTMHSKKYAKPAVLDTFGSILKNKFSN